MTAKMTVKHNFLRSSLFNISFYISTFIACIALLPTLILPRPYFMWVVHIWIRMVYLCEKYILGLTFEIRGKEHLPASGSYIVAAKHQSPYETMKLHMLFGDPAIILKKELLKIPLWGWYLKKSDVIAIDRSSPEKARESLSEGALHMMEDCRPIIIFPQGTRVPPGKPTSEYPYKSGIVRMQKDTGLPIIPLATNSGMFWLKGRWNKSPGKVVFQFLPPINAGQDKETVMRTLETQIENASNTLADEADEAVKANNTPNNLTLKWLGFAAVCLLLFGGYALYWYHIAKEVTGAYILALNNEPNIQRISSDPVITGFPGKMTLKTSQEKLFSIQGSAILNNITIQFWPVPDPNVSVHIGSIEIKSRTWKEPLSFDKFQSKIKYINKSKLLNIYEASLQSNDFNISFAGNIDFKQKPVPVFNIQIAITNHKDMLSRLVEMDILKGEKAQFIGFGLSAIEKDGIVRAQLTQKGKTLFLGPLPVFEIPRVEN